MMSTQSDLTPKPLKRYFTSLGIRFKIIVPYFLLTLLIAAVGTFVLINLISTTLQDRINAQLIDAGRIVSEGVVSFEAQRLETLRNVALTIGVPEALENGDVEQLANIVLPIVINDDMDAVDLVNREGVGIYGWQKPVQSSGTPIERFGNDWSQVPMVKQVLAGESDSIGDKFAFLSPTEAGVLVYSVGPVFNADGEIVGAVLVGTDLKEMTIQLSTNAVARVTFYDSQGRILETTLVGNDDEIATIVTESPEETAQIMRQLQSDGIVLSDPSEEAPYRLINILGQSYQLAFGEFRLRGQSFGLFSVAVPYGVLRSTVNDSRNLFVLLFSLATAGVVVGGFFIASRISRPIQQLVHTATAVTHGNLTQRSGIFGRDEIGRLAQAFDMMTETLSQRNQQLLEEASRLKAILDSIADGVMVLDNKNEIVTLNPAATRLLSDMSHDFLLGSIREISESFTLGSGETNGLLSPASFASSEPRRYQVGNRILGASAGAVKTPTGNTIGTVIVMRDITREVEADELKDAFITSISHELRSPLTVVRLSSNLLKGHPTVQETPKLGGVMDTMTKAIQELEQHIDQLINLSELHAGTLRLDQLTIDLNDVVRQALRRWQKPLEDKKIVFRLENSERPLSVLADVSQLSWAIDNLVENALSYTARGGEVTIRIYENDDHACLDVQDNGIGIAAADQPHLFDRFFRAHNRENYSARGVGLGLYITRSIVELHDGFVAVESESGVGSTFTIALPLVSEEENEPVTIPSRA